MLIKKKYINRKFNKFFNINFKFKLFYNALIINILKPSVKDTIAPMGINHLCQCCNSSIYLLLSHLYLQLHLVMHALDIEWQASLWILKKKVNSQLMLGHYLSLLYVYVMPHYLIFYNFFLNWQRCFIPVFFHQW